jgi:hypothetical protein
VLTSWSEEDTNVLWKLWLLFVGAGPYAGILVVMFPMFLGAAAYACKPIRKLFE